MGKKALDWANMGFTYQVTDQRYVANYKDGAWDAGGLTADDKIVLSEDAGVLQYSQSVFEGLKAYTTQDGRIVCFRPDLNAARMHDSALRLEMPPFPEDRFVAAVKEVVAANADWVPPYGSGATLYIRPYMFASSPVIGVAPAEEYQFRIFVTPVGPYFKGGAKPIAVKVSDFDRAAPRGTGHIKAGLNYANLVVPKSDSILPSITRRSLVYVAEHYLGLKVVEREVLLSEVPNFTECGLCGTAAVISPVGKINDHGREILFPSGMEKMGPVMQKLYDTLTGIQMGRLEAPEGWIFRVV